MPAYLCPLPRLDAFVLFLFTLCAGGAYQFHVMTRAFSFRDARSVFVFDGDD